jgi:ammonia channel protein AmtB
MIALYNGMGGGAAAAIAAVELYRGGIESYASSILAVVGGIIGAILTGVFNVREISGVDGSLVTQLGAVATTLVVSGVGSYVILKVIDMVIGLRVTEEQEREGLDLSLHGEVVQ